MRYESELSQWGDIDDSHPDGEFWAYESEWVSPCGTHGRSWIVTDRDMRTPSTSTYSDMGRTSTVTRSWRVAVKNGTVRRCDQNRKPKTGNHKMKNLGKLRKIIALNSQLIKCAECRVRLEIDRKWISKNALAYANQTGDNALKAKIMPRFNIHRKNIKRAALQIVRCESKISCITARLAVGGI